MFLAGFRWVGVTYLAGDQLVWIVAAFATALWFSNRIFTGMSPSSLAAVIGGLVFAVFMTDLPLFLAQDLITGIGLLALVIVVSQRLFNASLAGSAFLVAFSWIIGTIIIGALQGSLNIYNPWF